MKFVFLLHFFNVLVSCINYHINYHRFFQCCGGSIILGKILKFAQFNFKLYRYESNDTWKVLNQLFFVNPAFPPLFNCVNYVYPDPYSECGYGFGSTKLPEFGSTTLICHCRRWWCWWWCVGLSGCCWAAAWMIRRMWDDASWDSSTISREQQQQAAQTSEADPDVHAENIDKNVLKIMREEGWGRRDDVCGK